MEKERRRHMRIKLKGSKVILPDGQEGELANASISGIAFWQPNGPKINSGDTLSIVLTYQGEEINGEARVIHTNGRLVGCEWVDFGDEKQRMAYYSWLLEPEFD